MAKIFYIPPTATYFHWWQHPFLRVFPNNKNNIFDHRRNTTVLAVTTRSSSRLSPTPFNRDIAFCATNHPFSRFLVPPCDVFIFFGFKNTPPTAVGACQEVRQDYKKSLCVFLKNKGINPSKNFFHFIFHINNNNNFWNTELSVADIWSFPLIACYILSITKFGAATTFGCKATNLGIKIDIFNHLIERGGYSWPTSLLSSTFAHFHTEQRHCCISRKLWCYSSRSNFTE